MARIAAPGARKTSPSPLQPPWTPGPARYSVGVRHNVTVPMSDGVVLARRHPLPDRADHRRARRGPLPRAGVHHPLREESAAASRADRRRRDALPHQAGLHRGNGRRSRHRRLGRFLRNVRPQAGSGWRGPGRVGVDAAERERTRRHVRHLLPGRQPAVRRGRGRAELAAQSDLPGDGRQRLLPRRRHHGRSTAHARRAGLRLDVPAAQHRQPVTRIPHPRRP